MPKNTGKKLADMLYGDNPERAAFGVYPQAGKRGQRQPSAKQQLEQILSGDRAMDLPQFGDVDLSVPTATNRALGQRMTEREVDLKRQADRDMSPLEKMAGGMQAGRLMGSGLVQAAKSIPTAITKGGKAAEEYIAENIYKPTQPKAYEYAGDIGDFLTSLETDYKLPPMMPEAMALQHLLGPATQQARKAVPQAVRQGALNLAAPRTLNPQAGVIKMKGGNWLGGSVEKALEGLKRPDRATGGRADPKESMAEMKAVYTPEALATMSPETKAHVAAAMQDLERKIALNDWVDRNLGNYVKKEMATPEDPVRRLAEEGITHLPANDIDYVNQWIPEHLAVNRMKAGFPSEGMGQSNIARGWETLTDNYISSAPAREYTKPLTESEARRGLKSVVDDNPWLSKLDPETQVTYLDSPDSMREELGFDHILDVLRQDVAEGRIRPEQLNKVSMEQAVRRTAEYDQEMARKMRETQLKQQEGFPVHKEYPEGYKWIELRRPDTPLPEGYEIGANDKFVFDPQGRDVQHPNIKALEDALKYEGNTMGHCVGGYCPDVLEGRSRIYSLRDAKGEPHVTVEVEPMRGSELGRMMGDLSDEEAASIYKNPPQRIVQIKGKQNRAPKEDYLPYVQDFVRSGDWSDVGDFQNTGLAKLQPGSDLEKWLQEKKIELPRYPTKQELNKYESDFLLEQLGVDKFNELGLGFLKGENGMARGGPVHFSNNPDVMQLELAGGGIVSKLAKMARAPAKTKAEGGEITADDLILEERKL